MDITADENNSVPVKTGNVADMCNFGTDESGTNGIVGPEYDRFTNAWSN
ncbi:hypothetical protein AB4305_09720 [Nocardia sp. 2YAB30]